MGLQQRLMVEASVSCFSLLVQGKAVVAGTLFALPQGKLMAARSYLVAHNLKRLQTANKAFTNTPGEMATLERSQAH